MNSKAPGHWFGVFYLLGRASFSGLPSLRSADRCPPKVSKNAVGPLLCKVHEFFYSSTHSSKLGVCLTKKTPVRIANRGFSHSEVPSGLEPL